MKPCPHCGEPERLETKDCWGETFWRGWVQCQQCDARGPEVMFRTHKCKGTSAPVVADAEAAWDDRTDRDGLLLDALKAAKDGLKRAVALLTDAAGPVAAREIGDQLLHIGAILTEHERGPR